MPEVDEVIWRYMSFTKFVDLLSTRTLFFARSDRFSDPFEGSIPKAFHDRKLQDFLAAGAAGSARELAAFAAVGRRMREYVFVNCWHMSEYESEALWSLYVQSSEGVAIKSSRRSVYAALVPAGESAGVWSVPVRYIDFASDDPPVPSAMAPFRYKRRSFEHEKELRFIYFAPTSESGAALPPPDEYGLRLQVDLSALVQAVYVAPTSPGWFHQLTEDTCRKFNVVAPVFKSSISIETPLFGV